MRRTTSLFLLLLIGLSPAFAADDGPSETAAQEVAAATDEAGDNVASGIPAGRIQPADDAVAPMDAVVDRDEATQQRLNAVSHFMAGQLFEKRRDPLSAVAEYEQALALDPNQIETYRSFIPIAFLLDRGQAVVDAAREAATRFESGHDLSRGLAAMMAGTNRIDDAVKLLTQTLNIPRVRDNRLSRLLVQRDLGIILRTAGRNKEAAQQLRIVFEATEGTDTKLSQQEIDLLFGEGGGSYEEIGSTFLSAGLPDLAVRAFERAAEADPSSPAVHSFNLASVFRETGRPAEALEQLEKYFAAQLQSKGRTAYEMLESLLKELDRSNELLPKLDKLVEIDRRNTTLRYFYADKLRDAGRLDDAKQQYEVALGGGRDVRGLLGLISLIRLQNEQSATDAEQLVELILKAYPVVAQSGRFAEDFEEEWQAVKDSGTLLDKVAAAAVAKVSGDKKTLEFLPAYLLGRLMVDADRPKEAATLYRYALNTRSDPPLQLFVEIGQFLEDSEMYADAADLYRQAIDSISDQSAVVQAQLQYRLSNALVQSEQYDDAFTAIRKAQSIDPENLAWQFWEGVIAYEANKLEDAVSIYRDFIGRHQSERDEDELVERARFQLSVVYVKLGDVDEGAAVLLDILEADPNNTQANNDLGYLWADEGINLPEAEAMIRKAVAAEPDNPAYLDSLGWVLFRTDRAAEALPHLEQAASQETGQDSVIYEHLGDAYEAVGEPEKATKALRKALELEQEKAHPDTIVVDRIEKKLAAD